MPGSGSSVPAPGIGRALAIALALAIIGVATSAEGHHGIVNFDLNKDITIKGVIKRLAFVNPHADLEPTRPGKSIGHWGATSWWSTRSDTSRACSRRIRF